jgi:hypothetical protein
VSQLDYNVGLTEAELDLLIRVLDDDLFTDEEQDELDGIRKKLVKKRKTLRRRDREVALP